MGCGQEPIVVANYGGVYAVSGFDVGTTGGNNVQLEGFHSMRGSVDVRRGETPMGRTARDRCSET